MFSKKLKISKEKEIAYFEMISQDSDVAVVIIHGLAEHKGRYLEFINRLHSSKYSVFALDLIGHGESSGKRGDIRSFSEYVEELEEFISYIRGKYPNMKIGLFGHSVGGLVACCYISYYKDIEFLILSNPLLEKKRILSILRFLPYKIFGSLEIKKRHSESKEMLLYSRNDPLSCKYLTLRLLGEIFIEGLNYGLKRLPYIETPLLLLGGCEDNLVKTNNYDKIIDNFKSRDKTLKMYENVRHRLVHSAKKDEVMGDIANWIAERFN